MSAECLYLLQHLTSEKMKQPVDFFKSTGNTSYVPGLGHHLIALLTILKSEY